jgi:uncharacterized membrane protein
MNWYGILKLLHVLSAIVWIGGGMALSLMMFRLLAGKDRTILAPVIPQITGYMQRIGGPSAGLLLLTGIAMVLVGHLTFKSLWIGLGIGGLILLGAFGGLVMSKRMDALERTLSSGNDAALDEAVGKVRQASVVIFAIMVAIVAIMILKPTI